jgi:hypothetical protein
VAVRTLESSEHERRGAGHGCGIWCWTRQGKLPWRSRAFRMGEGSHCRGQLGGGLSWGGRSTFRRELLRVGIDEGDDDEA